MDLYGVDVSKNLSFILIILIKQNTFFLIKIKHLKKKKLIYRQIM